MASDIRADEWTDRGVVAQLGEHLHGMQGVGGSSPPSSTTARRSSQRGTAKAPPFVLTRRGLCHTDEERVASMTITGSEARTASDGRRWTLRPARPTAARALACLFAAGRREGRWLITPPPAGGGPAEAVFLRELLRWS